MWVLAALCASCAGGEEVGKSDGGGGSGGSTMPPDDGATGGDGSTRCTPGAMRSCTCATSTGSETCVGGSWSACSCPDTGAPVDAESGTVDAEGGGAAESGTGGSGGSLEAGADANAVDAGQDSGATATDSAPPPTLACPAGSLVAGIAANGGVVCGSIAEATRTAFNADCSLYFGWRDVCSACIDPPTDWGRVGGTRCEVGASLGTDNVCISAMLGTETVTLLGLSPDGNVNDDDKFYYGLACSSAPGGGGPAVGSCPAGEFVIAVTSGGIECAPIAPNVDSYVNGSCSLYAGWLNLCTACTSDPQKWGRVDATTCESGLGLNGSCISATLGTDTVTLYGLDTDGNVNADDKLYLGLRCGRATSGSGTTSGSCPSGQFVTGLQAGGRVECSDPGPGIQSYIESDCFAYYGQSDNCSGCPGAPALWGRVSPTSCENGAGANNTCTNPTLGSVGVQLFGLNPVGDVDDNDQIYVGLTCF